MTREQVRSLVQVEVAIDNIKRLGVRLGIPADELERVDAEAEAEARAMHPTTRDLDRMERHDG